MISVAHFPGWHAAAWSGSLAPGRLLPVTLAGRALVLFRGRDGRPAALEDRCPHRNAPLALGRVDEGLLRCGYHGWCFDASGACVAIPGLPADLLSQRGKDVPSLPARDEHGVVWVGLGETRGEPPRPRHLGGEGWTTVRLDEVVEATLADAVENVLDVPHTSFLHGGLFRHDGARRPVEVIVRRGADRVEAQYAGEGRPTGLLGRLLAPRGGVVEHVDRFILPCVAEVEYAIGRTKLLVTHLFTPVDARTTRMFHVIGLRVPLASALAPLVRVLGRSLVGQDARMLAAQSRTMERFGGERFTSTELDVLGAHVRQLLKGAGGPEPERRLTMML